MNRFWVYVVGTFLTTAVKCTHPPASDLWTAYEKGN